jgi:hypothetical protein
MGSRLYAAACQLLDHGEDGRVPRDRTGDHIGKDADNIFIEFEVSHAVQRCGKERVSGGGRSISGRGRHRSSLPPQAEKIENQANGSPAESTDSSDSAVDVFAFTIASPGPARSRQRRRQKKLRQSSQIVPATSREPPTIAISLLPHQDFAGSRPGSSLRRSG